MDKPKFQSLTPAAGHYQTPLMTDVMVAGLKEYPDHIVIQFRAKSESPDQTHELTIAVPIPKFQATGLLRSLKMLQEKGLIPFVPEPTETKN